MPCRPKLCQRLAAQLSHPPPTPPGSGHVWISDELLSEAFNRYVRVSHASRRYGSNVPGPLEARRRASKRRMGCAVNAAGMGPPGPDFGALFGVGGVGDAVEKGWTWKAPGLQFDQPSRPAPATKPGKFWARGKAPAQIPEWEKLLEVPRPVGDPVKESRDALEELYGDLGQKNSLGISDLTRLTEFLTSSSDEPAARNTSWLVEQLVERYLSTGAWEAVTTLICDKIQLDTLKEDELLEIVRALPRTLHKHGFDVAQLHRIYSAFWTTLGTRASGVSTIHQAMLEEAAKDIRSAQDCACLVDLTERAVDGAGAPDVLAKIICAAFREIREIKVRFNNDKTAESTGLFPRLALALDRLPSNIKLEVLSECTRQLILESPKETRGKRKTAFLWLSCLVDEGPFDRLSVPMNAVYTELAKHFKLSEMPEYFRDVQEDDIVRILLDIWLPNTDLKSPEALRVSGIASPSRKPLKSYQFGRRELSVEDFPVAAERFGAVSQEDRVKNPWVALIRTFEKGGVYYDAILQEVFFICQKLYGPTRVHTIFKRILHCPALVIPKAVAVSLIGYFLKSEHPYRALAVFYAFPSIAIEEVPSLPSILMNRNNAQHLLEILNRQPVTVPFDAREIHKLDLTQKHTDVVHLIAHDISMAKTLKTSIAYRHVWAYYRWLQDRGAPLQALISRAMVQAGILRPLQDRLWLPNDRLDYILSIVERVEGPEIRDQVETLARRMRSSVHHEVLAKRQAKYDTAWMDTTSSMARDVKFRVKKWAKRKPVPTEDGASYVVPKPKEDLRKSSPIEDSPLDLIFSRQEKTAASACGPRIEPRTLHQRPKEDAFGPL